VLLQKIYEGAHLRQKQAGAGLAWEFAGWTAGCTFGAALVAIALGLHACGRVAEKRVG
jgi:hypothetical protein